MAHGVLIQHTAELAYFEDEPNAIYIKQPDGDYVPIAQLTSTSNDLIVAGTLSVTGLSKLAAGTPGAPGLVVGDNDNGQYEVSPSQQGFSIGDALVGGYDSSGLFADVISEQTLTLGVTIDGTLLKDGGVIATAGITSSAPTGDGVGYSAGAGGTVVQDTSKTTNVTINKLCGQIATYGGALGAGAEFSFAVDNTTVAASDVVVVCIKSGATLGAYLVGIGLVSTGQFMITVSNVSAGSESDNIVLNYAVIKAVSA